MERTREARQHDFLDELAQHNGDIAAMASELDVPWSWIEYWVELAHLRRAQLGLEESCP